MQSTGATSPKSQTPKSLARACTFCRARKIRCDTTRPRCTPCISQNRDCSYHTEAPRKRSVCTKSLQNTIDPLLRPTLAQVSDLRREKSTLQSFINSLKDASAEERQELLASVPAQETPVQQNLPTVLDAGMDGQQANADELRGSQKVGGDDDLDDSSDEELDVAPFISVDEAGQAKSFGPSSALHFPTKHGATSTSFGQSSPIMAMEHMRNSLIANAALQRQREYDLRSLPNIDGVPTELALHLLDLHWNRQHHTFLLTYRPAIMRDLLNNGPHCSRFLLNAIFACSCKFSQRVEVRDDPAVPATSGQRFFRRCDELLAQDSLLIYPSLPTVVGLLLLGSTFNARGETSKGWLYTGYALRMVYDLGLHIDPEKTNAGPEEIEIRRRVFWGAFICDKLQALYLGRPVMINLRDAHVSRNFMDTIEEMELWVPYVDPQSSTSQNPALGPPSPVYSVSVFQHFCSLSKIMTRIITKFYVVGATVSNAKTSLQQVDEALQVWQLSLTPELRYENTGTARRAPPNLLNLHCIYHALIILLHRPFISDGHLRSTTTAELSWKRCTSAARSITNTALDYQSAYSLTSAPYILSYAIYVACTIHVRNAAAQGFHSREHSSLLVAGLSCLEELSSANPGVAKPANIIRRLMAANKLNLTTGKC